MVCRYCSSKYKRNVMTDSYSPNKAEVSIKNDGYITFYGERNIIPYGEKDNRLMNIYDIPASFCPVCGRKLGEETVHNTEQDYSITIRNNIKDELEYEHLSISALSEKTGIAKSTLSDFLSGKIECLSAGKIGVIADVLRLPVEKLYAPHSVDRLPDEPWA